MPAPTLVKIRRRDTREVFDEPIFAESQIRFAYEHPVGGLLFAALVNNQAFCDWYGRRMDHPKSVADIPGFVARFGIDLAEAERPLEAYESFNAFFERRLRPGARPFDPDPAALVAAGDGKVLVYPSLGDDTRLPIKGAACSLADLLADAGEAAHYRGGSALVLRLAPYDYHRFHFPDGGTAGPARRVPGKYHSVNPIALAKVPDLFCRNKRDVTAIDGDTVGRYCMIEVGALTVGTIIQTYTPGRVERGQEKGYFRFGGSTIVLLFEPGRVTFDPDLVEDSAAGIEVTVRAGARIGTAQPARA